MASPSPQKESFHAVYGSGEDFTGPQESRIHQMFPLTEILAKEQDGEIERIQVKILKRDGRVKLKWIWRATEKSFWFRGASCSAGPEYIQQLAQALTEKKAWAKTTLEYFTFRLPVLEL